MAYEADGRYYACRPQGSAPFAMMVRLSPDRYRLYAPGLDDASGWRGLIDNVLFTDVAVALVELNAEGAAR